METVVSKPKSKLSDAEYRVLRFVSLGKTNKEIASSLGVGLSMVKHHMANVLKKLRLKNRVEVAIYGLMIAGFRHESSLRRRLDSWRKQPTMSKQRRYSD
jgi:DNA-binding CsgD family transcriptional regulator